jgi:hypothetical protein
VNLAALAAYTLAPKRKSMHRVMALVSSTLFISFSSQNVVAEDAKIHEESEGSLEHTIVVGFGGASELELRDGTLLPGAGAFVEWNAIDDWLELEIATSILFAEGGVEVPIAILAKKPFRLARRVELMLALGPELLPVSNPSTKATYVGGEAGLDLMFWPWGRRVGLWVEPGYDLVFRDGVSQGVGATGGLLLGW